MVQTIAPTNSRQSAPVFAPANTPLNVLLSHSEDAFYGSLQRTWNHVTELEDMSSSHDDHDKFVYPYRFAEAELHRLWSQKGA